MIDGTYHTEAGSEVTIRNGRLGEWSFDWFEEPNACCDCVPYGVDERGDEIYLEWACDECGGHGALLFPGAQKEAE